MLVITKLIMIGIAVVCAVTLTFIVLEFVEDKVNSKFSKKRNRVHFYVSRDMDGRLYLYLGKPLRGIAEFHGVAGKNIFVLTNNFKCFGLNTDDFKYLKWEDEPVEVFVNMEDLIMEKTKKSVEQMAKEANGRSRACVNCSLFMNCNMITQKICSDAFIEGYIKGYKQGREG